jgi:hypothetical protein
LLSRAGLGDTPQTNKGLNYTSSTGGAGGSGAGGGGSGAIVKQNVTVTTDSVIEVGGVERRVLQSFLSGSSSDKSSIGFKIEE